MSSVCQRIIDDFGSALGLSGLSRVPWYLIAGKAGPNAVLKIVIPPARLARGYVLTVARHASTPVIKHEVSVVNRLRQALPPHVSESVPKVLVHGQFDGLEYFGIPFYESRGNRRIARRLARKRRLAWVEQWLTELGAATRHCGLTQEWLEAEYAKTISRIQADPRVACDVKRQVQESFETICNSAEQIPSVCCHGDLWPGNILWQHASTGAVVLDWGAARWPGLPCVDLCRFALSNFGSNGPIGDAIRRYCRAIGLDPAYVPALYDLYNVFVKAELDVAYATQPLARWDPFLEDGDASPSHKLSCMLAPIK